METSPAAVIRLGLSRSEHGGHVGGDKIERMVITDPNLVGHIHVVKASSKWVLTAAAAAAVGTRVAATNFWNPEGGAGGASGGVDASLIAAIRSKRNREDMPITIHTLSDGAAFRYEGSLANGLHFWIGTNEAHDFVPAELLERMIRHFRARTEPVAVGASRTKPPAGSLGAWLIEHRPGRQLASYVAAVLVEQRHAILAGTLLFFPGDNPRSDATGSLAHD